MKSRDRPPEGVYEKFLDFIMPVVGAVMAYLGARDYFGDIMETSTKVYPGAQNGRAALVEALIGLLILAGFLPRLWARLTGRRPN